ncbi:phosphoenolpyruvate synthase, partial [Candidatus Micrarchaeota archaeon]|nr:phosphoenolpyruvate synthase [Candidatus Micrarchaeota archaeon]
MKPIYWLKELSKKDLAIAGGKGANLAEMANIGLPVPPAFILSSGAYFDFIARSGIDALIRKETEDLDIQDSRKLQEVSDRIKAAIIGSPVPQDTRVEIIRAYNKLCGVELMPSLSQEAHVAVRSSATAEDLPEASFAGQQATFLNVRGSEELVKAVRKCWASLFEARAIYYRGINNFDHLKVGLAAVVQKMVQSEKSGVMFTVDPVTNDAGRLVIEGGFGLGEAIVSGLIIPDRYVVDKKTRKILLKQPAKQEVMIVKKGEGDECVPVPEELQEVQKLSEDEILSLADYGIAIEEHYQFPQDIEWAIEGDRIYIVQSRAITTLPVEMRE